MMSIRHLKAIFPAIVLIMIFGLHAAMAYQPRSQSVDPEKARQELEKTDDIIEEAMEYSDAAIVDNASISRAAAYLSQAINLQADAKSNYNGHYYAQSIQITIAARDLALKAIAEFRNFDRQVEAAIREVEYTNKLIEDMTEKFEETQDEMAQDLFQKGVNIQNGIGPAVTSSDGPVSYDPQKALTSTLRARRLIEGANRLAEGNISLQKIADRELDKTDNYLSRVEEAEVDSEYSRILEDARKTQENARASYNEGNYRKAIAETNISRNLVTRYMENMKTGDRQSIAAEYFITEAEEFIDGVRDEITESGKEKALKYLEKAEALLDKARDRIGSGDAGKAQRYAEQAVSLTEKAIQETGDYNEIYQKMADEEFASLEILEDKISDIIDDGDEYTLRLWDRAMNSVQDAQAAYDEGNYEVAVRKSRLARSLFVKILDTVKK